MLGAGGSTEHSAPSTRRVAGVAQLVEHTLGKGEVTGSIPVASSNGAGQPTKNDFDSRSRGRGSFGGSLLSKRG